MSLFFILPFSVGQVSLAPEPKNISGSVQVEPLNIKLSVNEVRLDVAVLDKKGDQITDLTADDFEVYQNNKRQKVLSSVYIGSQEDARRNIVFVVDDCSMSFVNGYYAKMALRNFVENQMQPGDQVAVFNTGYGNNALQMFLSDKHQLLARINAISVLLIPGAIMVDGCCPQGNALDYSIRVLDDMPGRKFLISITPEVYAKPEDFRMINLLADRAMRAGVVISFLDINGLEAHDTIQNQIRFTEIQNSNRDFFTLGERSALRAEIRDAMRTSLSKFRVLNPLPAKTGGVLIQDSNFFLKGIDKTTENLMKGYYLVTYSPPESTFKPDSNEKYQSIKVRVKRRGAVVHTRDGFFYQLEKDGGDYKIPLIPLIDVIYSPLQHAGLDINMSAGYIKNAGAGYLVRTWVHIAPDDVMVAETKDGGARVDLEMVCLASDANGNIQDSRNVKYTFTVKPENKAATLAWVGKHGIRFSTLLPVKKTGSYYVRVAVKDNESGKAGSAFQFVAIPDLANKGLELSSMFIVTSSDDLEWMRSDATKELSQGVYFPMFQTEDVRSPALRRYSPGDNLLTMTMLYNADTNAIARSEIETQFVLYIDGVEFQRGNPVTVKPDDVDGSDNSVPLLQKLTLAPDMPPGDYVIQLIATDKKNSKKQEGIAVQALGFTVVENQTCETEGNICTE